MIVSLFAEDYHYSAAITENEDGGTSLRQHADGDGKSMICIAFPYHDCLKLGHGTSQAMPCWQWAMVIGCACVDRTMNCRSARYANDYEQTRPSAT